MTGEYNYDILRRCHQILIVDDPGTEKRTAITIEFTQHRVTDDTKPLPITELRKGEGAEQILRALATALQAMGIFPEHPLAGEMKATKYHLEDMRKLYLRDLER